MFIITEKETNVVIAHGNYLHYQKNGYPVLEDLNTAYQSQMVDVYETDTDEVTDMAMCYAPERGFYINPNYIPPDPTNTYGIPDEIYHAIIDDYTMEILGGEL